MAKTPQTGDLRERHSRAVAKLEEAVALSRSFEADIRAENNAAASHRARLVETFGEEAVGDATDPSELAEVAERLGADAKARAARLIEKAQDGADKLVADLKAAAQGGADADDED